MTKGEREGVVGDREGETERKLPSVLKWLWLPGLAQAEVRSQEFHLGSNMVGRSPITWSTPCCFPSALVGTRLEAKQQT